MNRRTLLKSLLAATLAGCQTQSMKPKGLRVVVAGAGIIGASIAYHLAKAGASVTVIDKQGPATHASRGTFAWINATWAKQPRHYHALSQEGVSAWKELESALDLPIRWGGSLEWFDNDDRQIQLQAHIAEQANWGEPARMIDATEVNNLEPHLATRPGQTAAFSANDGSVDPILATHKLLDAAKQFGVAVHYPCELLDVSLTDGRLASVETTTGPIPADRVVLATGAAPDLPRRIAGIDIPQRSTPGVIALTTPMPRLINRIIVAPGVHMHQREDGRVVLGEQDGAPDTHAQRLRGRPNDFPVPSLAQLHGQRILDVAARFVPELASAEIEDAYIGWRPLPLDGHPVLGRNPSRPDAYLAIMHSGVSLAPIVGQLVTRELTENLEIDRLTPYRPTRPFERVKRY